MSEMNQFRERVIDKDDSRPETRLDGSTKGWSLSRNYYKDPAVFEREKNAIFYNNWIFAGHNTQIPEIGDFFNFKLLDESIIVIRTSDDSIGAYYNVCRHRGSQICKESSGSTNRFVCPYHGWVYDIDGNLNGEREMPEGFNRKDIKLHNCNIELIGGMIFLNLSDKPTSLENAKTDLADAMEMFDFENLKIAAHQNYQIKANWKLTLENYQECYHCALSHPEYALSHTLKVGTDKFTKLQKPMEQRMEACGIKKIFVDKQFDAQEEGQEQYAYGRYALFDKYKTGSEDGEQVAPLLGNIKDFDHGASDFNIGVFTYFLVYNDHAVIYVFTPTDHETSACDVYWLVRKDAEEGKDYDVEKLKWLWHVTTLADERIITDNQLGVNSKKYAPGRLSNMEYLVEKFIVWYLKNLSDQ